MTTPTVNVTLTVNDQTGAAVAGATVTARLTGVDLYNAITVFPATQTFTTDVNGLVTMPLFPNALGTRNTAYQFKATDPVTGKVLVNATLVIPNAAVDVSALIGNTPAGNPYPLPSVQPYSDILTSMASLTTAADKMHYWSGEKQAALTTITAYGRSIVATANAAAMIALMGLGTMATQNASAVAITGGTINATVIGGTTSAAGAFTTLSASGAVSSSNVQVTAAGSNAFVRVTSASTNQNFQLYSQDPNAGNRNWAIIGSNVAYGDLNFKVSTAAGGDPLAAGTVIASLTSTGLAVTGAITSTGTITGNADNANFHANSTNASGYSSVYFQLSGVNKAAIYRNHAAAQFIIATQGAADPILLLVNSLTVATVSSTGLAVTGAISATGAVNVGSDGVSAGAYTNVITLASPAASGSTRGDFSRILDVAGSRSLDTGVSSSGAWLQSRDQNDYSVNYTLQLNPNGGSTTVGGGLAVTGALSATGLVTASGATNGFVTDATNGLALFSGDPSQYNISRSGTDIQIKSASTIGALIAGTRILGVNSTGVAITGTLSTTGVATFAAGTVALPSITTSGDTNTGIYFPAADTVGITAAGVEAARFSGSTLSMTGSPALIRNISSADGPGLRLSSTQISLSILNSLAVSYSGAALLRINTQSAGNEAIRIDSNLSTTNPFVVTQIDLAALVVENSPIYTVNSATIYSSFHAYTTHNSTAAATIERAGFYSEVDYGASYVSGGTSTNSAFLGHLRATNAVTVNALRGADIVLIANTVAATIAEVTGFNYRTGFFGGGATLTNHYGVRILPQTAGTNIYGIASEIAAAASRWNLYVSGTAQNYFAGNVGIGATAPGAKLEINTGATTTVGQIIQMVASQTADVLRVTRSDTNLSLQFTPSGQLSIGDFAAPAATVITTGPSTSTNANLKVSGSNVGNPNIFIQSQQGGGGSLGGPTSFVYFGDNNRALSYIGGTKINAFAANASSDLVFGTTSDISTIAVTERMRINASGIVLVGTASATGSNLLQVNSDIRVNGFTLGKGASSVATNTGFGLNVFSAITTGAQNTAFGYAALSTDTTGFGNAAFGLSALQNNNGGAYNTALGHSTLYYNTTGTQNTAVGHACMGSGHTTGFYNTGVGYTALQMSTTGVATLGAITGGTGYTTGTYPGVVMTLSSGSAAATYPTATIVVAGGVVTTVTITSAGARFVDTTTVLTAPAASIGGTGSGFSVPVATLIAGSANTGVGHQAILFTTVGGGNTAIGYQAGRQNTTGNSNTSFGSGAGYSGVIATGNTAIGTYALNLATGGSNVGLGYSAGSAITTGSNNVVIGGYTGSTAPISTTGSNYVVLSDGAGNIVASSKTAQTFALQGGTLSAGTGIAFPATQSASTDVNTLDDYEEGTWTPAVTSITGTITTVGAVAGTYTKIGRSVTVFADVTITTNGTGATGIFIAGLPFIGNQTTVTFYAVNGFDRAGLALAGEYNPGAGGGNGRVALYKYDGTYPGADGKRFIISLSYDV